jgi:hypothetical protein
MQSPQYLRDQARFYLEMAKVLSDPHASESAKATAARYLVMADKLEQDDHQHVQGPHSSG